MSQPPATEPSGTSRQGRPWLWVAAVAATLVVVVIGVGLVVAISRGVFGDDSGERSTVSPAQPSAPATPPPRDYQPPRSNTLPVVALGRPVELRTQDRSRVRVTALGVVDPASPGSYILRPKPGRRWVGLRVRIEGLGPAPYQDALSNGARLLAGRRAFRAVTAQPDGCPSLPAIVKLERGRSTTGCLIFEIPRGTEGERFRFTPSSGFAPDVATWRLPPR